MNDVSYVQIPSTGEKIYLDKRIGVRIVDVDIESPEPEHTFIDIPGADGALDAGTTYKSRNIGLVLRISALNAYHYALIRTKLFQTFDSRRAFYIVFADQPRRRWTVKYNSPFSASKLSGNFGDVSIQLISPSAYSSSFGDMTDPFTFQEGLWEFGMNIPFQDNSGRFLDFKYKHSTTRFSIWNLGDAPIDPNQEYATLEVVFRGASENLRIENITNGTVWSYQGKTNNADEVRISDIWSYKNNQSIFSLTNRRTILLEPGENKFNITGASGEFEVGFNFPFYYL